MEQKRWAEIIIFLIIAIAGFVDLALFLFGKAGAEVGILGIFAMMVVFWYSLLMKMNAIEKNLLIREIEMKKEIKELKNKRE
ncbi:MAG: hypothetical protein EF807_07725 [Candidatus Methanolliviera hydrocarbonicum]|uniref:Uncharacterized protein n=1 Tax=Candidatus Methanolliviera hydrocarbonicum TaxID=2491085 RepID=A0A520KUZ3_9EURY|nr:MAG: hypothetical protein EF807_07725 [Candidatus Methanolliviera hydrocarbonicum]